MRQSSQSSSRRSVKPAAKRASVLPVLLSGIVLVGAGTMVAALGFPSPNPQPQPDPAPEPLTGSETRVLLNRAGLDVDTLTSIGLSSEQIGTLIGQAQSHLSTSLEAIRAADRALASARRSHDDLYRKVQSGTATDQESQNFQVAKATLATSKQTLQDAINTLQTAATRQLLSAEQAQLLHLSITNKAWDLPQQYRLSARTEAEWVTLRDALAVTRIAERTGEPASAAARQIIAAADSDTNVANAAQWLSLNGPQNRQVFEFVTNSPQP